ncbi:hypothetical protein ES703_109818 [subsurface metagenome]
MEEVKAPLKVIRVWGKIAQLTRARKVHECAAACELRIEKREEYYRAYHTGATFGAPDYGIAFGAAVSVHSRCINNYLNFGGKKCQ